MFAVARTVLLALTHSPVAVARTLSCPRADALMRSDLAQCRRGHRGEAEGDGAQRGAGEGTSGRPSSFAPRASSTLTVTDPRANTWQGHARAVFGRGQIIRRDRTSGVLWAGSDGRADGMAIGF